MINVFLESLLSRVLSLAGSHSPPHPPRMPSNTMLVSGPAVGAAQILIWSYTCVFLPPMSTAIRTSVFSFVGALDDLSYVPQTQTLPSWPCGFNVLFVQLMGRFWVFSLSHTALGLQLWFSFHPYTCVTHWGLLLRLPWRTWVCPCEAQVWRRCSCLGRRGLAAPGTQGGWRLGQQEICCSWYGNQCWPISCSILAWRTPL